VGAYVVLVDGHLTAWRGRGARSLVVWLPEHEPERGRHVSALARALAENPLLVARAGGLLIAEVNGHAVADHPLASALEVSGFVAGAHGYARTPREGSRARR
jgi:ATP-dependent Lhr-like helicase